MSNYAEKAVKMANLAKSIQDAKVKVGEGMLELYGIAADLMSDDSDQKKAASFHYNETVRIVISRAKAGQMESCAAKYGFPLSI